jgi:phenylalanyl-tRNA synthetase beta chain
MHPGRCARVELDGVAIGHVGELHPRWCQAYELPVVHGAPVVFELDVPALLSREVPAYVPVPKQQAVTRDLALIVREDVHHDALMSAILAAPTGGVLRGARLFDVYRPQVGSASGSGLAADERSLAIRLELLDEQAALTDERSDEVVRSIVAAASEAVGARLRGA